MPEDARYRTKVYLETYLDNSNLTEDDDWTEVTFIVAYADPDYPLIRVFAELVDLVFAIGDPDSIPLKNADHSVYGYEEHVPITVWCVDKSGITGTKLKWKAEAELRRILEEHPLGSIRSFERIQDYDQNLGSTVLHSRKFILKYVRDTT